MSGRLTKSEIADIISEYSFIRCNEQSINRGGYVALHNVNHCVSHLMTEINCEDVDETTLRHKIEGLRLTEDRLKSLLSEENEEISWFTRELFKGTDIDPESAGTLIKTIAENIVEISRQEYAHYVTDELSAVSTLDNVANIQALIDSRQFD